MKRFVRTGYHFPKSQTGVALFISLVLLLILTIIGVSSVQTTTLELRMSRNEHDRLLAFQSAESALRDAEAALELVPSTAFFDGTNGLYQIADMGNDEVWWAAATWTGGNSTTAPNNIDGVAAPARYIVEHMGAIIRENNAHQQDGPYANASTDRIEMFRITARGVGGTANSVVVLQTTYGRIM
ncbi:MAG: pilus assembly protein [Pseudomonadota bacterium]